MNIRNIAFAIAAITTVSASPVLAQNYAPAYRGPIEQYAPIVPFDVLTTGSINAVDGPGYDRCPSDAAAEGNANQQARPVKQYGQTSGGPRC